MTYLPASMMVTRVSSFTATTASGGVATFLFSPAFTSIREIIVVPAWTGTQYVGGIKLGGSRSTAGVQIQGLRSRATLLLSSGPFETAPSGVTLKIVAIGH